MIIDLNGENIAQKLDFGGVHLLLKIIPFKHC